MVTSGEVEAFASALREIDAAATNAEIIENIAALERLKSAATAAQLVIGVQLDNQIRAERRARGVPEKALSKGVASQLALARGESPNRGAHLHNQARVLVDDMPNTLECLWSGELNEWRTALIVKELTCLDSEDRRHVDRQLCADSGVLKGMGDRAVRDRARELAVERDYVAVVERARKAPSRRTVTVRPTDDAMANLHALLPVRDAVAVQATLARDADAILSAGDADARTRNQVVADLLVERCTGVSTATGSPVEVVVVLSDEALIAGGGGSAQVQGYGPIPAAVAREIIADSVAQDAAVTLRKLYARPSTGAVTAMESAARAFPKSLAKLIDRRDQWCRTPYCNAQIRHRDHVTAHTSGGPTSEHNGAGLCAACNYAKEAQGWSAVATSAPGELHSVEFTTPTGHRYRSAATRMPEPMKFEEKAS